MDSPWGLSLLPEKHVAGTLGCPNINGLKERWRKALRWIFAVRIQQEIPEPAEEQDFWNPELDCNLTNPTHYLYVSMGKSPGTLHLCLGLKG